MRISIGFEPRTTNPFFFEPKQWRKIKSQPSNSGGKPIRALSTTTTKEYNGGTRDGSSVSSHGRRGLLLMASLPLLLPGFNVNAEELSDGGTLIIREEVKKVLSKAKAAGVLRLVFHDAGTFDLEDNSGGMNGSIIYELERPENAGLSKSIKVLERAKLEVEKVQQVSWADMIAMAGAEAVSLCGGPQIPVRLGRIDARVPDPEGKLPLESLDASELKKCFLKKGFSTQELVVLSGAHTLGGKGFGNPNTFDNIYFKILLEKPWTTSDAMTKMVGLPSDHVLVEDDECLRWVNIYASDQSKFFDDFKMAYIKLTNTGVSWRNT
ncbi:putative L-ascorbate peroxidase 6 [Acorus calamus]|uniref:L-ascorbate peroxidase n=1 Tax=Acorus calamus TaxID=4465 RepID=A0AAV9E2F7_ACOCL|nr:putative L-ascorbate peroxidase 6 [Acorus calamus]